MQPASPTAASAAGEGRVLVRQHTNTRMKQTGQCLQYLVHSKEVLKVRAPPVRHPAGPRL